MARELWKIRPTRSQVKLVKASFVLQVKARYILQEVGLINGYNKIFYHSYPWQALRQTQWTDGSASFPALWINAYIALFGSKSSVVPIIYLLSSSSALAFGASHQSFSWGCNYLEFVNPAAAIMWWTSLRGSFFGRNHKVRLLLGNWFWRRSCWMQRRNWTSKFLPHWNMSHGRMCTRLLHSLRDLLCSSELGLSWKAWTTVY